MIVVFVEQKNSFVIEKKNMIYMFSVDFCNIPEWR
jgi:hypothetical protein